MAVLEVSPHSSPVSISRVCQHVLQHCPLHCVCPTTLCVPHYTVCAPLYCVNVSFCVPMCPRTLPATLMQRKVILRQYKGLKKWSKAWWTTVASLCGSVAAIIWMASSASGQWSLVASQKPSECLPLFYSVLIRWCRHMLCVDRTC